MRKLTRHLLWAFVFTVPWDNFALPLVGSVSRVFGLLAFGAAALTTVMEGRFRKPDAVLGFAIAFSVWGTLSLLWTMSYESTVVLAATFAQFVCSVWAIREFVRTREEVEPLLDALCFGLFVPLLDLLNNFRLGHMTASHYQTRYTGSGLNADQVGLYLVLGLPIAWHLLMHRRGVARAAALIYLVTAPAGLLLTATRGAFVAGVVACAIVPLTLARQSLRSYALVGVLLILGTASAVLVVPRANWERILGTTSEVTQGGSMSGRTEIWRAGLQAFPERPLLGAGFGAYAAAVYPYYRKPISAHNLALGLLVEDGIIGLGLFGAILGACAWTIFCSRPPYRALWCVLLLTWVVGGLSGSPETVKLTWVLFGLVAAQSGMTGTASDLSPMQRARHTAGEWPRTVTT